MNGSYALTAMILIALDHHQGQWCALSWIAERVMAPEDVVQHHCHELVDHEMALDLVIDGRQFYGVEADAATLGELVQ